MRILNRMARGGPLAAGGLVALALLALASAATAVEPGPVNLDLEKGELGKAPDGWVHPKPSIDAGYKVQLTDEQPKSGKRCALISRDDKEKAPGSGYLMQSFDAAAYRGKRVRLRAAVRAEVSGFGNYARLWLRVDRKDDQPGFSDDTEDRPTQKEWRDYEILGEVAEDAVSINLGLMLTGDGRAWLDAVSFEVIGKAGEGNEPARPLRGRALDNLVAFTKLLGYVRYFHPSDEAAATNWERFAIEGVQVTEEAKSPAELAQVLDKLFRPIAPTVRVFPTGQPPARGAELAPPKDAPSARFVAWYHFGVGTGNRRSIYSSVRVNNKEPVPSLPREKLPEVKLPDPRKPFDADLGAGASCSLPLALYADEKGTLPRTTAPAKAPVSSKPQGFVPSGNDRSTRLAAAALAWNVFQHFYMYFDVVKADWPGELRRALTQAATDADEHAFLDTLRRLVAGLHDGHGSVVLGSPTGSFSYFLPLRWEWIEDHLVVTRVAPNGADSLKPGDVVVKINGRAAAEALADKEQLISSATPQWKRYMALMTLAEGGKDSDVTLDVLPPSGQAQAVRVRRTLDVTSFWNLSYSRPAKIEEIKPGVMYVNLGRIADKEFEELLPKLERAKGIIFENATIAPIAHLIDKPVTSAQWHIPVTLYPDRQNVAVAFSTWEIKPKAPRLTAKVAFLSDGGLISYFETVTGIIEHYKLGAIVGGPTAGTNGNINPFTLPGGYRVVWTGMKVLKHDGSRHHGVGIQPTVPVARTIKGVTQGRDEVLERALEVVSP